VTGATNAILTTWGLGFGFLIGFVSSAKERNSRPKRV